MAELPELTGQPTMLGIPRFTFSTFALFGLSDGVNIVCSASAPALDEKGQLGLALAPQAFVTLSPVAAKELSILLSNYVAEQEKSHGEITSDFIERSKAK